MTDALNTFRVRTPVRLAGNTVDIFSLPALEQAGFPRVPRLPYSLKVLLENLLRHEDGAAVSAGDIKTLANWNPAAGGQKEIAFTPARVLLQDLTGVPAVVDLAAMRDGIARLGGDPARVNPLQPVELVIDHSVQVDHFGHPDAARLNAQLEFGRNRERYQFLRWGQQAFKNFKAVPPDTGIVHQVNLEYLARVVFLEKRRGRSLAFPDTLVGTDSHTTMVNGLGVVGWGVGGIEAEAAMLGQPISMLIPDVIGFRLKGRMPEGVTATDVVLTITERLRREGVVGAFVEFCGSGLRHLTLADRATLSNMCPEYGATIAIFPIDEMTIDYLRLTGRDPKHVALVEEYAKAQGLFATAASPDAEYARSIELDLAAVEPCLAGPRRPHDRVPLKQSRQAFEQALPSLLVSQKPVPGSPGSMAADTACGVPGVDHGAVVIASITSCTNTSNPSVMIGAGLLARKAVERGLRAKPWVKTSLAPGSQVVTDYLDRAGLTPYLDQLGFNLVGYGCATCIGNSGPLPDGVTSAVKARGLVVASVISGNRNFEGRIQPLVRANYLASPPLVVAFALAGTVMIDLTSEPIGRDAAGRDVFLGEIWPTEQEIQEAMSRAVRTEAFREVYGRVFDGDEQWRSLPVPEGERYQWDPESTYIRHPPFFEHVTLAPAPVNDIIGARVLAVLGDSVTTDHVSPAGSIPTDSPAGKYLIAKGVAPRDFNSYGARRGNHEVMVRGTFANIRLRNQLVPGVEGGWTIHLPDGEQMSIFDAATRYRDEGVPLIVLAGKEYGSGSSRDWAAKGTVLLGVRAVLAESFERIHRSNLVNMGVLPLQFKPGQSAASLQLTGRSRYSITGISRGLRPGGDVTVRARGDDGSESEFWVTARIDTPEELVAFNHGGILPYVLRQLVRK
ncbi:MAG: aconitate hydratase AcnA [Acidobacteria bacterium]|nr:aconitate hydratase AcnA [Acidobacteriota bacterium]